MCAEKNNKCDLLKDVHIATVSNQTSIAIMALSPVTTAETCSKTEYAEELSMVFWQNPGLLISHKDHSIRLVVRRFGDWGLLYRLFKQQSAPVWYISSATLQETGQVSAFVKHSFCTILAKLDALVTASKQKRSYLLTPQLLIIDCAVSSNPQLLMILINGVM